MPEGEKTTTLHNKVTPVNCKICGHIIPLDRNILVEEMMFGTKESFMYYTCDNCGCVQIGEVPKDLSRFYPDNYYSYNRQKKGWFSDLKIYFQKYLFSHKIGEKNLLGQILDKKYGHLYSWVRPMDIRKNSRILDVGCGAGVLLRKLRVFGYTNLTGVDPFIQNDILLDEGLNIYKRTIFDLDETYDVIMVHHALEHMDEQQKTLSRLSELLNPGGILILALPLADGVLYERYGKYWFGFDAPRHLYLHTRKSITILAEKNGMVVTDIINETIPSEIWVSELYSKNMPLSDDAIHQFTKKEMRKFKEECRNINKQKKATIATFYLQRQGI